MKDSIQGTQLINEQFLVEHSQLLLKSEVKDLVEKIKLDAFKAGAEWAANIIPKFYCESHDRHYAARQTRDRVVDEISKLKEIPK